MDRQEDKTHSSNVVEVVPPTVSAAPDPVIEFAGSEEHTTSAGDWMRYDLNILNSADFPPELFVLTSAHGPCGSNTNPSRTWANIMDDDSNARLCGFCGLESAPTNVHFAKRPSDTGPWNVRVDFVDRQEDKTHSSNVVQVTQGRKRMMRWMR